MSLLVVLDDIVVLFAGNKSFRALVFLISYAFNLSLFLSFTRCRVHSQITKKAISNFTGEDEYQFGDVRIDSFYIIAFLPLGVRFS